MIRAAPSTMNRLIFFLFFLLCQWPAHSAEVNYGVEKAFVQDQLNQFTIDSVPQASFKRYQNDLNLGFQTGTTWVRLTITPSGDDLAARATSPLIVRVTPYSLDLVDLYERVDGRWQAQPGGDRRARTRYRCPDDVHCFALGSGTAEPSVVYLNVQTDVRRLVQIEVTPADRLADSVAARVCRLSMALTLATGLLVLGLAFFVFERSALVLMYCGYQLFVVLYTLSSSGLLAQWLPQWQPETINTWGPIFLELRLVMVTLMGWAFLSNYQAHRRYHQGVAVLIVLFGIAVLMTLFGHRQTALTGLYMLVFANLLLQIAGLLMSRGIPKTLAKIMLGGYITYLIVFAMSAVILLGEPELVGRFALITNFSDWRLNGLPIGIVVFWIAFTDQANRKMEKLEEIQTLRLQTAQAQANEEKLSERRMLIDMLTHELKNPLATIKFALASLRRKIGLDGDSSERFQHIVSSVDRMNALIEHVALSNKVERAEPMPTEKILAAELVRELPDEYSAAHRFELHIAADLFFNTDRQMLTVIIENLLSNAYKYSAGDQITVKVRNELGAAGQGQSASVTCFEISNPVATGSEPDESRLFERYYRHPSVQNHAGMGIGLSIVESAAKKIGAAVGYRMEAGLAIFEVRIPQ